MAGLYEAVIEELCADRREGRRVLPKIICSTATIRRYEDQIRALYGRVGENGEAKAALFPPPGLDAGDSFFAKYARESDGTLCPGRKYIGVYAPGLSSLQTAQVRAFTALLQAPVSLPSGAERDPWWTLMLFFNSLRELGTTLTLFQSDIPDYLKVVRNRLGADWSEMRHRLNPLQLTGRSPSYEIPDAIDALEVTCSTSSDNQPVDVCLASSIIEVGIDIDRLSLIAVVGQPKTTSQYIQVTGRVGRSWWERPGLVVTIYSPSKPRDRSHFEKFRSYHERLYAQVEPTSVTPFSPPVVDRALHAVIVAYVRQVGNVRVAQSPYPCPEKLIQQLRDIIIQRVRDVDPQEEAYFARVFDDRVNEWRDWEPTQWGTVWQATEDSLLMAAGAYAPPELALLIWPIPLSMRNVDAECEVEITQLYLSGGDGANV